MPKAVATFEIDFSQEELEKFSELSKQWNQDFASTVRECMNRHCDDMLTTFSQAPDDDTDT
jgi:hypothetical protein